MPRTSQTRTYKILLDNGNKEVKKEPKDITPEKFDENNRDTKDDPFKGTPIEGKD